MHTERIDFWSQSGREQVGGLERASTEMYITTCETASGDMLHDAGNPLCDNTEGWGGEGGGKEV